MLLSVWERGSTDGLSFTGEESTRVRGTREETTPLSHLSVVTVGP